MEALRVIRKSAERGGGSTSWLDSRHTFSFANYFDPDHLGFRSLRVINEDWIAPSRGFGAHPHRDMEILTYPIEGALQHRDSEGHVSTLRPGRVQLMRAGSGIVHSEMNPLADTTTHLLQIWIEPDAQGLAPGYQESDLDLTPGVPVTVASKGGLAGGFDIHQDVTVTATRLGAGDGLIHPFSPDRYAWLHVVSGSGRLLDFDVEAGDGVSVSGENGLVMQSEVGMEVLTFDLA
jgi:redox-sensitive bicupin YhaK (pirin superfamily)